MDPRPKAYEPPPPMCSRRSFAYPEVRTAGSALLSPSSDPRRHAGGWGPRPRAPRLAGARGGGPPGNGGSGEPSAARAALKLAPPSAHGRTPPSPSPKAPSQWASRKGRACERETGRGSRAGWGGREAEGGRRLTDSAPQPIRREAPPLPSLLGSVLRPAFAPSAPRPRPAPPPLPHSAGKSLLERGGGRSGRLVWSLAAELTGGRTNRR